MGIATRELPTASAMSDGDSFIVTTEQGTKKIPLTWLQSIFAPSGYGLGTYARHIDDFNNAMETGWYQNVSSGVEAHTPDGSIGWIVRAEVYGESSLIQFGYRIGSPPMGVYQAVRYYHVSMGGWNEWEFLNPSMTIGMEYRTIERYNGKPVYTKLIDFGYIPVNTYKIVAHNIQNIDAPLSITGSADGCTIPSKTWKNGFWYNDIDVLFDKSNIQIVTRNKNENLSDSITAYLTLRYTKTTD